MQQVRSANVETLKEAGYRYSCPGSARGLIVLQNADGGLEVFARRSTPISGWQIKYRGAYWEFCRSGAV